MQNVMKRIFDIVFSLLALTLFLPLMILIALSIKCTSKGPIFHQGLRAGKGGKLFTCWKFRTMQPDAKKQLPKLLKKNPSFMQEWKTYRKLRKDPRITAIGKCLRLFSLDELPQFWNVLIGDLSIVGPRPVEIYRPDHCVKEIKERFFERDTFILSIRPGITGLWQISGRNLLTTKHRIELEEQYVKNRSFLLDLKIICKTVYIVIFAKGAL